MMVQTALEVAGGCVTVGAVVFASGRFAEMIRSNTRATEKLSEVIDGHLKWSAEVFSDHDTRITILEEGKKKRRWQ